MEGEQGSWCQEAVRMGELSLLTQVLVGNPNIFMTVGERNKICLFFQVVYHVFFSFVLFCFLLEREEIKAKVSSQAKRRVTIISTLCVVIFIIITQIRYLYYFWKIQILPIIEEDNRIRVSTEIQWKRDRGKINNRN